MRIKSIIFVLATSLTAHHAFAEDDNLPFQPVQAASQPRITVQALKEETDEMQDLLEWQAAKGKLATARLNLKLCTLELARGKALHDAGHITDDAYATLFLKQKTVEGEILRMTSAMDRAKTEGQLHMFRVLQEGNPDKDYRSALVDVLIADWTSELNDLNAALEVAILSNSMAQEHLQHGRTLNLGRGISEYDVEQRNLAAQVTAVTECELRQQIQVAQKALQGFTTARLQLSNVVSQR